MGLLFSDLIRMFLSLTVNIFVKYVSGKLFGCRIHFSALMLSSKKKFSRVHYQHLFCKHCVIHGHCFYFKLKKGCHTFRIHTNRKIESDPTVRGSVALCIEIACTRCAYEFIVFFSSCISNSNKPYRVEINEQALELVIMWNISIINIS